MVIKREIIYPIFLECVQFAENKFWKSIFEDLSYGKCPYGSYIHKNYFSCNFKGKEFSYKLENNNPELVYENIFSLLTKKLGLLSEEEKKNKMLDYQKIENEMIENKMEKWSSIKKKSLKDSLIQNFIIKVKKDYNLNNLQLKSLQKVINLGLIFKTISHKDIHLEDGQITVIDGIEFENGIFRVTKDLIVLDNSEITSENIEEKIKLIDVYRKMFLNKGKKEVKNEEEEVEDI
jgi:hypothetical protein